MAKRIKHPTHKCGGHNVPYEFYPDRIAGSWACPKCKEQADTDLLAERARLNRG